MHGISDRTKPEGKHTIFVENDEEVENFDPVEFFQTVPEAMNRTFNRPRREDLEQGKLIVNKVFSNFVVLMFSLINFKVNADP